MFIKEIHIDSFGCLVNKTYKLQEGINVLFGENESGKTTFLAFILFAFYGFKIKKQEDSLSFKKRYFSWHSSSVGGSVTFVSNGLEYTLKRECFLKNSSLSLYCLSTAEEIKDNDILSNLGEYFFGVSAESFCKTAFLSAVNCKISPDSTDELITKIRNAFETGSVELSYKTLSDKISSEISDLSSTKKRGSTIPILEKNISELENKLAFLKEQSLKAEDNRAKCELLLEKINSLDNEIKNNLEEKRKTILEESKPPTNKFKVLYLIFVLSLVANAFLYTYHSVFSKILGVFLFSVLLLIIAINLRQNKANNSTEKRKLFTIKRIDDKIITLTEEVNKYKIQYAVLKSEENNSTTVESNDTLQQLIEAKAELVKCNKRLDSLLLARECVSKAYNDLKVIFSPELSNKTGEIFCKISLGKYKNLLVNDSFDVSVMTENGLVPSISLSRGTIEQIYFSLRVALLELISSKNNIPLFFDDAFAFYDSKRLECVFDFILNLSSKKQIFISTCRNNELNMLSNKSNIIYF